MARHLGPTLCSCLRPTLCSCLDLVGQACSLNLHRKDSPESRRDQWCKLSSMSTTLQGVRAPVASSLAASIIARAHVVGTAPFYVTSAKSVSKFVFNACHKVGLVCCWYGKEPRPLMRSVGPIYGLKATKTHAIGNSSVESGGQDIGQMVLIESSLRSRARGQLKECTSC